MYLCYLPAKRNSDKTDIDPIENILQERLYSHYFRIIYQLDMYLCILF